MKRAARAIVLGVLGIIWVLFVVVVTLAFTGGIHVGVYKPVLYVYPEREQSLTVSLDVEGELGTVYPAPDALETTDRGTQASWTVTASPDGTLTDQGLSLIHISLRKTAAIAKANAQKEVAQATAIAQKEANDAQVASQLEIAQKQTDLAKRQAALKVEADTEKAKADAAYEIQSQIQRRDIERETAQADIVKQEQQAVIKEKEVVVTKQALQAEVNAKADAERYAAEKKADAALYARQRQAEAEAFERTKKADADKQACLLYTSGSTTSVSTSPSYACPPIPQASASSFSPRWSTPVTTTASSCA